MGKRLKEQCEWVESIGYSSNGWIGGDWHTPLHLLSKLLAGELETRKETVEIDCDSDVTLKISFDSLLQLAEDTLGVPVLITERDLLTRYPNIHLALVTYLVCLRNTIEHIDPKLVRNTQAPRLIFEAKNGLHSSLPSCPECNEHVFIIERVVIERVVYHRQCMKCIECGKLLSRGAFKKTKNGFECIAHAVRRILDAHESSYSSGSGTYDRYRYSGRSPRPGVVPPPRPKPKPPPKPAYLSARAEPDYETLDEIQAAVGKPIQSNDNARTDEQGERQEVAKQSNVDEAAEVLNDTDKKRDEKEIDDTTSTRSNPGSDSHSASADDTSSGDSVDSGVVLRMTKLFGEVEGGRGTGRSRISQPPVSSPVPPPRPKRTSMLISSTARSHSASPAPSPNRMSIKSAAPTPAPKPRLNLEDYPGYLCPFGEDEEMSETSDYPSGKNPFADSDDESSKGPPVPAPRSLPPPVPVLPGTSDRPKVQPPPPPPGAQVDPSTPPPKPPRSGLNASDTRIHTLRISRKKFRAPLPPVPLMRKINFTENGVKEEPAVIAIRLKEIEEQMTRIEIEGRAVEKEMLFQIDTNPRTWTKSQRIDDWVVILTKKLELMREQLYLLGLWRENYLNEVHSETEYYIRCLLEKEKIEKSEWEMEREATLTNLLISIIDEKLKLDEYMVDHGGNAEPKKEDSTKAAQKKHKLKKRVLMLSKKLKSKKSKEVLPNTVV